MTIKEFFNSFTPRGRLFIKIEIAIALLIVLGGIFLFTFEGKAPTVSGTPALTLSTYISSPLQVSFKYPYSWNADPNSPGLPGLQRYEGSDGFFEPDGRGSKVPQTIDQVVSDLVNHVLKPYGQRPTVTKATIQGQPARYIVPSNPDIQDSVLVVAYPKPVTIGETVLQYFVLYADRNHVMSIGESLRFNSQQ